MTAPAGGVATRRDPAPVDHGIKGLPLSRVTVGEDDEEHCPESFSPTSEKRPSAIAPATGGHGEQHRHSPGLKTIGHPAKAVVVRKSVADGTSSGGRTEDFADGGEDKSTSRRESWLTDVVPDGNNNNYSHVAQVSTPVKDSVTSLGYYLARPRALELHQ